MAKGGESRGLIRRPGKAVIEDESRVVVFSGPFVQVRRPGGAVHGGGEGIEEGLIRRPGAAVVGERNRRSWYTGVILFDSSGGPWRSRPRRRGGE